MDIRSLFLLFLHSLKCLPSREANCRTRYCWNPHNN